MRRPTVVLVSDRSELIDQLQNALDPVFDLVVMVAHPPSVLSVVGAVGPAAVVVDRSSYALQVEDTLRMLQQEEPGRKVLLIDDGFASFEWEDWAESLDLRRVSSETIMPDLLIELRRAIGYGGASWRVH